MRPVEKKKPGETVEYKTSNNQKVSHTIQEKYNEYSDAKWPLVENLGAFCSYCEEPRAFADIHVEHVEPKSKEGAMCDWENFLLACNMCNSIKSNRDVDVENTHFPHRDNTYLDFVYDESGRVKVNPDLPAEEYDKAENLYNLVKLGRGPFGVAAASESDYRWRHRYETWNLASIYLKYYEANSIDLKTITDLSMSHGNWSIWFTIFKGHDEVRKALIDCFPGTCASCFDSGNHYEPIPRK